MTDAFSPENAHAALAEYDEVDPRHHSGLEIHLAAALRETLAENERLAEFERTAVKTYETFELQRNRAEAALADANARIEAALSEIGDPGSEPANPFMWNPWADDSVDPSNTDDVVREAASRGWDKGRWEIRDNVHRILSAPAADAHPEPYTPAELREAYESWRTDGQAMHRVLLDIWHYAEPEDTKHMTYGEDHEAVAESVRRHLRHPEPPTEATRELISAMAGDRGISSVQCDSFADEILAAFRVTPKEEK